MARLWKSTSGQGNHIHHNVAIDNHTFSELGDFADQGQYVRIQPRTFLAAGLDLPGDEGRGDGYGPVANTRLLNNTVVMTGPGSQGFVCHGGCNGGVLMMRNNVIQAVLKAGYADGAFDEDYNLYAGGITQFPLGPHSAAVGTRPSATRAAGTSIWPRAARPWTAASTRGTARTWKAGPCRSMEMATAWRRPTEGRSKATSRGRALGTSQRSKSLRPHRSPCSCLLAPLR